ncbi:hypothetical protein [Oceaniferula spumae]
MKYQVSLIIAALFVALPSCQKQDQAPAAQKEDHREQIKQLETELAKAQSQLKKLEAKNEELTKRIIEKEAEASTLTKVMQIGAKKYAQGADRAGCILNIRNLHQAVRAHQNLHGFNIGDKITWSDIIGPEAYIEKMPVCPMGGDYVLGTTFPQIGKAVAHCPHEKEHKHAPDSTDGW